VYIEKESCIEDTSPLCLNKLPKTSGSAYNEFAVNNACDRHWRHGTYRSVQIPKFLCNKTTLLEAWECRQGDQ
jgi:hypothetical protein